MSQNKSYTKTRKGRHRTQKRSWLWIGLILGSITIIIGVLLYLSHTGDGGDIVASDPAVFNTITHIHPALLEQVGTGSAQSTLHAVKGEALLTGAAGKPAFLYVGGEYCPYCAAQRWAVVVALSRFGTFQPLSQTRSSEQNLATVTFRGSVYASQYIDFVGKELKDNQSNRLDTLTPDQQHIYDTFNAPPYVESANTIPFIDIANRYVSAGSYYLPDTLANLSWQQIATQSTQPDQSVAKGVLGSANYLTAAVCASTQDRPTNVCRAEYIQKIEKSL